MKKTSKKKPSLIEARQVKEKEAMLEHLLKMPIIEVACQKTGIGRSTYYRWLKEDKKFLAKTEDALGYGRDRMNDMAESVVVKKVSEGDLGASKYYLSHNHPNYHAKSQAPPRSDDQPRIIYLHA